MNCSYPTCQRSPLWTPVVEMPTIRSVGVIRPVLSPLIHHHHSLDRFGLNRNLVIRQYKQQMREYKEQSNTVNASMDPTYLVFVPVCSEHKETYNLLNWIRQSEWNAVREAARHYGMDLPEAKLITVQFKPLGWLPKQGKLELARDRMAKEEE